MFCGNPEWAENPERDALTHVLVSDLIKNKRKSAMDSRIDPTEYVFSCMRTRFDMNFWRVHSHDDFDRYGSDCYREQGYISTHAISYLPFTRQNKFYYRPYFGRIQEMKNEEMQQNEMKKILLESIVSINNIIARMIVFDRRKQCVIDEGYETIIAIINAPQRLLMVLSDSDTWESNHRQQMKQQILDWIAKKIFAMKHGKKEMDTTTWNVEWKNGDDDVRKLIKNILRCIKIERGFSVQLKVMNRGIVQDNEFWVYDDDY